MAIYLLELLSMNFKNIDDTTLIKNTEQIAVNDRKTLISLLHHLREIEKRRLFSALGYQSLFDFVVNRLKYSEDEAQRRISTMRLMRELPDLEQRILDGSLKLTNICLAQRLFSKEKKAGRKYSSEEKLNVIDKLEDRSTRDALNIVSRINPEMKKTVEFDFNSIDDDALRERLIAVKGLYAHIDPNMSLKDLLGKLCDLAEAEKNKSPAAAKKDSEAEIYRRVWRDQGGKCVKCGSTHAVQHDHIVPWAAGGETTYENLRLLCRNCNLRAAIEFYGRRKMENYLSDRFKPYGVPRGA
jgi:5-methylcytosine-specific restriction endonuclease McrA